MLLMLFFVDVVQQVGCVRYRYITVGRYLLIPPFKYNRSVDRCMYDLGR